MGIKMGEERGEEERRERGRGEERGEEGEGEKPSHAHLVKAVSTPVQCTALCQHCSWLHRYTFLSPPHSS